MKQTSLLHSHTNDKTYDRYTSSRVNGGHFSINGGREQTAFHTHLLVQEDSNHISIRFRALVPSNDTFDISAIIGVYRI